MRVKVTCLALAVFLLGLGAARLWQCVGISWLMLSGLMLAVSVVKKRPVAIVGAVVLFSFMVGWWRGSMVNRQLAMYQDLRSRKVVIMGRADSDAVYDDHSQLTFDVGSLQVVSPGQQKLVGKISAAGFGADMVHRGDKVQVSGKLYSSRGSHQASISFASVKVLSNDGTWLNHLRLKFLAGMQSALPEPLASFGLGLLIGTRNTLPAIVTAQLALVGLSHLIAVSGYNLTILMRAVRRLSGHRSKYQMTVFSLLIIGAFLIFTGLSASIVRAALVSILSLGAWYYGRQLRPLLIILLSASLTAGWYPLYLWSDLGWWLSFLAFFGVLILAPLMVKRVYGSRAKVQPLTLLVFESLAAQIMTLPLMMLAFGQFSVIALVANVLVVPLVPIAMLFSLVAGLSGMFLAGFAGWLAWPARVVLTYMLDVVTVLSRLPHVLHQATLEPWQLVAAYILLLGVSLVLWHKSRRPGIITDIN